MREVKLGSVRYWARTFQFENMSLDILPRQSHTSQSGETCPVSQDKAPGKEISEGTSR